MSKQITMFTVPRYFKGNFGMIQRNAIKSWLLLNPTPEIILCGNEDGTFAFAAEIGVKHISDIKLTDKGTPLLNDVFAKTQAIASHSIIGYFSSDIIFTNDLLETIDKVSSELTKFMMVGQRWDCRIENSIDFSGSWEANLRTLVSEKGKLHAPAGMDYHIFEKGFGLNMPPFIVGRPAWDNWFLSQALHLKFNVVDCTGKVFAVHQTHDYSHIEGGFNEGRAGLEATRNRGLAGAGCSFTSDSNWKFSGDDLVRR